MLSKSQINFIKSLNDKKIRQEQHLMLVEGGKVVLEVLQSTFIIHTIYLESNNLIDSPIKSLIKDKNIKLVELGRDVMKKISSQSTPSGIIALVFIPNNPLSQLKTPILVLDNIQDPGNLGTLIRLADWFKFPSVVTSPNSVIWHNAKVIQSSMGSFLRVKIYETEINLLLKNLKSQNLKIFGAEVGGESLFNSAIETMEVLVLGNESHGISIEIKKLIDHRIGIPREGEAESLNVAMAGAIICSERYRQKLKG